MDSWLTKKPGSKKPGSKKLGSKKSKAQKTATKKAATKKAATKNTVKKGAKDSWLTKKPKRKESKVKRSVTSQAHKRVSVNTLEHDEVKVKLKIYYFCNYIIPGAFILIILGSLVTLNFLTAACGIIAYFLYFTIVVQGIFGYRR